MNYSDSQDQRDTAYTRAYRDWIASLPPAQRADLAARNLDKPDTRRNTGRPDDALTLLLSSSPADQSEPEDPRVKIRRAAADALASFCARVRAHSNPLLAFDSLCFATGLMEVEGLSQTALSHRHGITKAAFSKQVVGWTDLFDLPPPRGCRTLRARSAHRRARLAYLKRRKEIPPISEPAGIQLGRKRRRYPSKSENPTIVYVRGLDSFRLWFHRRTRSYPVEQWSPEARRFLCNELAWFKKLYDQLAK